MPLTASTTEDIYSKDKSYLEIEYPVMEHFYTIQGEGLHSGKPAYFIRLGGCDVQCFWCDVKESWDESIHPRYTVKSLVDAVKSENAKLVVITGGEPSIHDLSALTQGLKEIGVQIHIETSGSSPLTGHLDWVTLSPKRFKAPLTDVYPNVDELKIVVLRKKDLEFAEYHASMCPENTKLLLQPEWDMQDDSLPLIIDYVKNNPHWQISLQTHKFMGVR